MRKEYIWNIAAHGTGAIVPPVVLIFLARLLNPEDFGIFALASALIIGFQAVATAPLGEVIVQSKDDNIVDFIWTLQSILGLLALLATLLLAPFAAEFFNQPELAPALSVMAIMFVISPFLDVAVRLSMRRIKFKGVFLRMILAPVSNGVIAIWFAFHNAGYWALIYGQLGGTIVAAIALMIFGGWLPRFHIDLNRFQQELKFSKQMMIQGVLRWIRNHLDKAALGSNVPGSSLGQYDMASRVGALPFTLIVAPISQVSYSVMSTSARSGESIKDLYILSLRRLLLVVFPLIVVMAMNTEGLILLLLGEKWLESQSILLLIIYTGFFAALVGLNNEVFKALGKPKIMTKFLVWRGIFTVPAFLGASQFGIFAVAVARLFLAALFSPINAYLASKLLNIRLREFLRYILLQPILFATIVAIVNMLIASLFKSIIITLLISTISGLLIVLLAFWFLDRNIFTRTIVNG